MNPLIAVLTLCMGLVVAGVPTYIQGMILKLDGSVDIRKVRLSKGVRSVAIGLMSGGALGIIITIVVMAGMMTKSS